MRVILTAFGIGRHDHGGNDSGLEHLVKSFLRERGGFDPGARWSGVVPKGSGGGHRESTLPSFLTHPYHVQAWLARCPRWRLPGRVPQPVLVSARATRVQSAPRPFSRLPLGGDRGAEVMRRGPHTAVRERDTQRGGAPSLPAGWAASSEQMRSALPAARPFRPGFQGAPPRGGMDPGMGAGDSNSITLPSESARDGASRGEG
jgi:hypothetical protein